ncbi:MAG: hypothetical protein NZ533_06195 [Casimicrobiaceae bacterium]|nr:hypothetical protein [Casimicrobiaceae bacterium]MCX8098181.1 hypothetical protein [Casimicrobiaceae bacterium]
MATFTRITLYTDTDGFARFREEPIPLDVGAPPTVFSALMPSGGWQLRRSEPGFASDWHCTPHPQWVVILSGVMEIGLRDGSWRRFGPGEHFFCADTLPPGETFDPTRHGHRSRNAGTGVLETLFVRA